MVLWHKRAGFLGFAINRQLHAVAALHAILSRAAQPERGSLSASPAIEKANANAHLALSAARTPFVVGLHQRLTGQATLPGA